MNEQEISKTVEFFGFRDGVRRLQARGVPFEDTYRAIFGRAPRH